MALPRKIVIHELGPREGMQIEKNPVSTAEKVRLIDLLSACHFPEIEVVSFVNPKWVPQMADAEQVVEGFAPTSRAAYQLEEAGIPAATLQYHLAQNPHAAIGGKHLYFVDESSLASTQQVHDFFQRLNENDRVVFVGDPRQPRSG